jgi:hypothetical protein
MVEAKQTGKANQMTDGSHLSDEYFTTFDVLY